MTMGRKPNKPGAIPRFRPRKQKSGVVHYYYDLGGKPRKELPLGSNYALAIKKWAELEGTREAQAVAVITFRHVSEAYRKEVIIHKAPRTQLDNAKELTKLLEYFDDPPAPLDAIQPVTVRKYMTWRTKSGKGMVRANREKALLSHIWNFARDKGYTALPNPCAGIKGFKETGRDIYIEDDQFEAMRAVAHWSLQDAMDLAYLIGQRPADVLSLTEQDVRDGAIHIRQGKTKTKLRIAVEGELEQLLERLRRRKDGRKVRSSSLIIGERGKPVSVRRMSEIWAAARAAVGADVDGIHFRDLRAKAATDKADSSGDIRKAQHQLGHTTVSMTEHYTRKRRGHKSTPTR